MRRGGVQGTPNGRSRQPVLPIRHLLPNLKRSPPWRPWRLGGSTSPCSDAASRVEGGRGWNERLRAIASRAQEIALQIAVFSRAAVERAIEYAFTLAESRRRSGRPGRPWRKLTLVAKSNAQSFVYQYARALLQVAPGRVQEGTDDRPASPPRHP